MNQEFRAKLERRATRLAKRVDEYKAKMEGKEQNFTFHGGFDYGYHTGKLEAILTILDEADYYD